MLCMCKVGAGKEMQGAEVRSATLPYEEDRRTGVSNKHVLEGFGVIYQARKRNPNPNF